MSLAIWIRVLMEGILDPAVDVKGLTGQPGHQLVVRQVLPGGLPGEPAEPQGDLLVGDEAVESHLRTHP